MRNWIRIAGAIGLFGLVFYSSSCPAQDSVWQGPGWYLTETPSGSITFAYGGPFATKEECIPKLNRPSPGFSDECRYFATKDDYDDM